MAHVLVPNDYFEKSKQEYSDWRYAWIREALQNAYDAGAATINFTFESEEDRFIASCIDDGCGMTRDILIGTLLCLGGSKKEEGAVGKFGYAKTLLFFAHQNYLLLTQHHCVKGSGGEYSIDLLPAPVKGTQFHVSMKRGSLDTVEHWTDLLKSYARTMTPARPVSIQINGVNLKTNSAEHKKSKKTSLGLLKFSETDSNVNTLVVSVRGLPMFVRKQHGVGRGISGTLELNNQDWLTTNRDSLQYPHNAKLDSLFNLFESNRSSLSLGRTLTIKLNHTKPVIGCGSDKLESHSSPLVVEYADQVERVKFKRYPLNFIVRLQSISGGKTEFGSMSSVISNLKRVWVQELAFKWVAVVRQFLRTPKAYAIGVRAAVDGEFLDEDSHGSASETAEFYYCNRRVTAGFILASGVEGMKVFQDDILILVNPQLLGKKYNDFDLFDLAAHELSHLVVPGHNESFVSTDIDFRRSWRNTFDGDFAEVLQQEALEVQ